MTWEFEDLKYPVKNGLPSGWKTTSIFGTLFNQFIIRSCCSKLDIIPSYLATHGDDVDLELPNHTDVHKLLDAMNEYGFEV